MEWKYILFEHNDTDEELRLAQEIADDIGVDSLLFIITNSKWHSERFTVDSPEAIPLRSMAASVSPATAMTIVALDCLIQNAKTTALANINRCTISTGKFLTVEGWALDSLTYGPASVELLVNGEMRARSRTSSRRNDVVAAHPQSSGVPAGFMFRVPVDVERLPARVEVRVIGASTEVIGGRATWISSGVKQRADLPIAPKSVLASGSGVFLAETRPKEPLLW